MGSAAETAEVMMVEGLEAATEVTEVEEVMAEEVMAEEVMAEVEVMAEPAPARMPKSDGAW